MLILVQIEVFYRDKNAVLSVFLGLSSLCRKGEGHFKSLSSAKRSNVNKVNVLLWTLQNLL